MQPQLKPFKPEDLGFFTPNQWSNPDDKLDYLGDKTFEIFSLWLGDRVETIMCFKQYHERCYFGFFLVSNTMSLRMAAWLRHHICKTMAERNALRLHTDSVSCDELKRWHKFLGFTLEGTRVKLLYGQDYDMWAIVRKDG